VFDTKIFQSGKIGVNEVVNLYHGSVKVWPANPTTGAYWLDTPMLNGPSNSVYSAYSSSEQGSYQAWEAHTTAGGTKWTTSLVSNVSGYIDVYMGTDFVQQVYLSSYIINGHFYNGTYHAQPRDWTLEASKNKIDWVIIDTRVQANTDGWVGFNITPPDSYKYYRVHITRVHSGETYCGMIDHRYYGWRT